MAVKKKKDFATIIADASFCPDTSVGGYGYWISSQYAQLSGGGQIDYAMNNEIAEIMAVVLALEVSLVENIVGKHYTVLVQTDCLRALDVLSGDYKFDGANRNNANNIKCRKLKKSFYNSVNKFKLQVIFKHIRGHTIHPAPKYVAQRLCDKTAKKYMKRARKKRQNR